MTIDKTCGGVGTSPFQTAAVCVYEYQYTHRHMYIHMTVYTYQYAHIRRNGEVKSYE